MEFGKAIAAFLIVFLLTLPGVPAQGAGTEMVQRVVVIGFGENRRDATRDALQKSFRQLNVPAVGWRQLQAHQSTIADCLHALSDEPGIALAPCTDGIVRRFNVLNIDTQTGITKITASIEIDINAIQHQAEEPSVDASGALLIARDASQDSRQVNKVALLGQHILLPILQGRVIQFSASSPYAFHQFIRRLEHQESSSRYHAQRLRQWAQDQGDKDILVFNVTTRLAPEFRRRMKQQLKSIATYNSRVRHPVTGLWPAIQRKRLTPPPDGIRLVYSSGRFHVPDVFSDSVLSETFLLSQVRNSVRRDYPIIDALYAYHAFEPRGLKVSLLDADNSVLHMEILDAEHATRPGRTRSAVQVLGRDQTRWLDVTNDRYRYRMNTLPWSLLSGPGSKEEHPLIIVGQRKFYLLLALDRKLKSAMSQLVITLE